MIDSPPVQFRFEALGRSSRAMYRRLAPIALVWLSALMANVRVPCVAVAQEGTQDAPASIAEPVPETIPGEPTLPRIQDMPLPTTEELLRGDPVDWVVLKTDEVLVVRPVSPRPDTLGVLRARLDEHIKAFRLTPADKVEEWRAARDRLYYVDVVLPDGEDGEPWQLHTRHIREIIYFEDLVLRRAAALLDAGDLRPAFELLFLVERRAGEWPGLKGAKNRLLLLEGRARIERGDYESALTFLEELYGRDADHAGLSEAAGEAADALIAAGVSAGDYRQARHFVARLAKLDPEHTVVASWRERFAAQSAELLEQSQSATRASDHASAVRLAEDAARVWPQAEELSNVYRRAARRWPRLHVGVVGAAAEPPWHPVPTAADERAASLTTIPYFEVESVDSAPHYGSRLIENWMPEDLGRRVHFALRPAASAGDSRPRLTATDVADGLQARLDPADPRYDERLAGFVESVSVRSPFEFDVRLRRVPLRTESLFAFAAEFADAEASSIGASFPFVLHERGANLDVWRRGVPQPEGLMQYRIAEVVEHRYGSFDQAVQGLLRGEVSMLPQVRLRDVARLRGDRRFGVVAYGLPTTHLLQFNPRSEALAHGELRRALAHALDVRTILSQTVCAGAPPGAGRPTAAPWSARLPVTDPTVAPREHDPAVAATLAVAAKRALGGALPTLRVACPADEESRAVVSALIEHWRRIGVAAEIVDAESDGEWDVVYRTVRMTDPVAQLWPLLTLRPRARLEDLAHLPVWLRQELLDLDTARDWSDAEQRLRRLHRLLHAEALIVPLWEVDVMLVIRTNVRGLPENPLDPYQGIERWSIEPWYATDTPL